jgi:deoxyribodipyrimidine photo-lyase
LQKTGSSLLIRSGTQLQVWKNLLEEYDIAAVYTNHDYEPYAAQRDKAVEELLTSRGIEFHTYKEKYAAVPWRNNEKEFEAWRRGKTGYPLVDAGMRELNETGYMHNRVRMVTAGFLTKHLLIDWRWGERYFAKKLLDYDLSANNGNWQWAAGCGCDAAPYFRIFNPAAQLENFDSQHKYIRKWLPEINTPAYPAPMVEHQYARQRALDVYKKALD